MRWKHYAFRSLLRPSVRPLTSISRDAMSLYLVELFHWNLPQIFSMLVWIAEKVFKVEVMTGPNATMMVASIWTAWRRGLLVLVL